MLKPTCHSPVPRPPQPSASPRGRLRLELDHTLPRLLQSAFHLPRQVRRSCLWRPFSLERIRVFFLNVYGVFSIFWSFEVFFADWECFFFFHIWRFDPIVCSGSLFAISFCWFLRGVRGVTRFFIVIIIADSKVSAALYPILCIFLEFLHLNQCTCAKYVCKYKSNAGATHILLEHEAKGPCKSITIELKQQTTVSRDYKWFSG